MLAAVFPQFRNHFKRSARTRGILEFPESREFNRECCIFLRFVDFPMSIRQVIPVPCIPIPRFPACTEQGINSTEQGIHAAERESGPLASRHYSLFPSGEGWGARNRGDALLSTPPSPSRQGEGRSTWHPLRKSATRPLG